MQQFAIAFRMAQQDQLVIIYAAYSSFKLWYADRAPQPQH